MGFFCAYNRTNFYLLKKKQKPKLLNCFMVHSTFVHTGSKYQLKLKKYAVQVGTRFHPQTFARS